MLPEEQEHGKKRHAELTIQNLQEHFAFLWLCLRKHILLADTKARRALASWPENI